MIDPTVTDRIFELGSVFELDDSTRGKLLALLTFVEREPTAPTTVTDPRQAVDVHIADSLTALSVSEVRAAGRVADIGTGAGFPGLVLASCLEQATVSLVESLRRKCDFVTRAAASCGIENVSVVCSRAEQWSEGLCLNDVVTARAVAALAVLLEYAAPLLTEGGLFVAWKGARSGDEERDAELAASLLGMESAGVLKVEPFKGSVSHHLHLYRKTDVTPDRFPRRAGLARKRPLVRGGKVAG